MIATFKNTGIALVVVLVCLTSLVPASYAQTEDALAQIKDRVDGRKAEILRLRNDGLVKENADGKLEPTAQLTEQQNAVVDDENKDRLAAFRLIAEENGLSTVDVQQLFNSGSRGKANATSSSSAPNAAPTSSPTPATPSSQGPSQTPASDQSSSIAPPPQASGSPPDSFASPPPTTSSATPDAQPPPAIDNSLPAKLINRPASSLYADASEASTKVQENMKGFMVYYIADQMPGWYQVASTQGGSPLGWLKESEAILWQHNLAVRFAHEARGNRLRTPFFGNSSELEDVLRMSAEDRKAVNLSAVGNPNRDKAMAAGVIAVQPPVVSRNEFYVLPITQHQKLGRGQFPELNRPAMMLRVAAMKQQGGSTPTPQPSSGGRLPAMDVVFVMDLTASMGPFVQATLEAMRNLAGRLESSGRADSFRFGLWGYKDSKPDQDFGNGRVTKNFTPALQERSDFVRTLQGVRVSSNSAGDWPESVFDGVNNAIKDTNWTPNALRLIVLVGDASGHPLSNQAKNPSRLDEGSVRALATQNNCYILPLYIKANSPAARDDADKARPQFIQLSQNPNLSTGSFLTVEQGDSQGEFRTNIDSAFFGTLFGQVERAANGESAQSLAASAPQNPSTVAQMTASIFSGAYLDWVAAQEGEAEAVDTNLQGWVLEKDLVNTDVQALDVVFLITRSQLDTLKKSLDKIIDEGVKSQVRGVDFFSRIQNIVGQAAVNPSQISSPADAESLRGFLQGLPYDSEVLSLTADDWRKRSPQDRDALLDRCQSQITYYERVNADTAQWRPLNDGDDPTAYVAAIPLDRLP